MSSAAPEPRSNASPRCVACDEVIGVYEPCVHVDGQLARETSRAAEPDVCRFGGVCYHVACYERVQGAE